LVVGRSKTRVGLWEVSLQKDKGNIAIFSWEEKLVAPLIATPNVDKAVEDKNGKQKKLRYRLRV
jgi:hypothetical protein